MKFKSKIQKFMYGRYGSDELYIFLFRLYFLLFIINIFLNSNLLMFLELLTIIVMFYRFFSKNIYKRSNENVAFIRVKKKILKPLDNIKRNFKDNNHIYKRCPKCKTVLRLPIPFERGIKKTKCPNCNHKMKVLVLRKQKIEIIKNVGGKYAR